MGIISGQPKLAIFIGFLRFKCPCRLIIIFYSKVAHLKKELQQRSVTLAFWQFFLTIMWHEVHLHILRTLPLCFGDNQYGKYGTTKRHRCITKVCAWVVDQVGDVCWKPCDLEDGFKSLGDPTVINQKTINWCIDNASLYQKCCGPVGGCGKSTRHALGLLRKHLSIKCPW